MTGIVHHRRAATVVDADRTARELLAAVVPYNRPTRVVDPPGHSDTGDWDEYVEEFAPHAFTQQLATPLWRQVTLIDRHGGPAVGYALGFDDDATRLRARFRVHPRAWDDVAQMLDDGLDGISGEFIYLHSTERVSDGDRVRVRVRAVVERVALEPIGAYADARVLAVRAGRPDPTVPTPRRDELAAYLSTT